MTFQATSVRGVCVKTRTRQMAKTGLARRCLIRVCQPDRPIGTRGGVTFLPEMSFPTRVTRALLATVQNRVRSYHRMVCGEED